MNTLRMLGEIDGAMQEVQGYGLEDGNHNENEGGDNLEEKKNGSGDLKVN